MSRLVPFTLTRWLRGFSIWRIDGITGMAVVFAMLLVSAFSNRAFTIGSHFFPEIPIALFCACLPFASVNLKDRMTRKFAIVVGASAAVLLMFFIIGIVRGAPMADAYADMRAQVALVSALIVLFSMDDMDALRFVTICCTICLASFVLVYLTGMQHVFVLEDAEYLGKVTYPWPAFVTACLFAAYRRSYVLVALGLAGMAYMATHTSYRYAYIVTALTAFSCVMGPFLRSRSVPTAVKSVVAGAIALVGFSATQITRVDLLMMLNAASHYADVMGVPEAYSHQLLDKPIHSLTTGVEQGDLTYVQFAQHLLDVPRFAVPQGLGHKSSYGDPLIFGGNTVDNSVIFFDYHFSIWMLLGGIALLGFQYWQRTRDARWFQHAENAVLVLPIAFIIYIRAFWFVDVTGALSLAMALRMCASLASPTGAFVRAVPAVPTRRMSVTRAQIRLRPARLLPSIDERRYLLRRMRSQMQNADR